MKNSKIEFCTELAQAADIAATAVVKYMNTHNRLINDEQQVKIGQLITSKVVNRMNELRGDNNVR